ncbi:hypothetical protein [Nesterenkonia xinjiangensis]|uniref:Uncharacterized protein n=1 Tax=Nesterenkonia xinjiangensis TaxID=225327 RepID=A0A7Z0GNJ5_9MICC|nr:hypothetical protein [Nesterenkonia xinjiangensis]NYJ79180.1 hypothetical protein [Nesterenkonia xinjiangensis]
MSHTPPPGEAAYFPAHIRARAYAYTLAVYRGDPHRAKVLDDLDGDDLLRAVEALAAMSISAINAATGGNAEACLSQMQDQTQRELLHADNNTTDQEG